MNKKVVLFFMSSTLLLNISTARATNEIIVDWTGSLAISGFSNIPGKPLNSDADPKTMMFEFTVAAGSTNSIALSNCLNPTLQGGSNVTIENFFGSGKDFLLDPTSIIRVATLLTPGNYTFPPGVTQPFNQTGTPFSTIDIINAGAGFNSTMNITSVNFAGNTLKFDAIEVVNAPPSTLDVSTAFSLLDFRGNRDGKITRPFIVKATIDCENLTPAQIVNQLTALIGQNISTNNIQDLIKAAENAGLIVKEESEQDNTKASGTILALTPDLSAGQITIKISTKAVVASTNVKPIPSMSSFGLLLLTPLLGMVPAFRKKIK